MQHLKKAVFEAVGYVNEITLERNTKEIFFSTILTAGRVEIVCGNISCHLYLWSFVFVYL